MEKKIYVQHENSGIVFDTARSWVNTKEPEFPPSQVDMSGYHTLPELIERCLRMGEDPRNFNQNEYEFSADEDVSNAFDIGEDIDLSDLDGYVPSAIGDAPDFSDAVQNPAQEATESPQEAVDENKARSAVKEETATTERL